MYLAHVSHKNHLQASFRACVVEGVVDVKLPTMWRYEKAQVESVGEEKQKQVAHVRGKVGKSRRTVFVQSVVAPESRKVGSQKRRASSLVPR